jgi:RNA polymerase sigma-70 factor (ECF subfamily)
MTHPEPTADLLAAIATGDEAAFERLFRAWYGRLADHAHRMTQDRDRAEDAVQEVFVALWKGRDRLPEAAALTGYLHRAVRNRALNQLRATRGDRVDPDGLAALAVPPTAIHDLEAEELGRAITLALEALPPRTREIFLLSREQGLSYREIATTLEISIKTVETLMGRGLRELRDRLGRA